MQLFGVVEVVDGHGGGGYQGYCWTFPPLRGEGERGRYVPRYRSCLAHRGLIYRPFPGRLIPSGMNISGNSSVAMRLGKGRSSFGNPQLGMSSAPSDQWVTALQWLCHCFDTTGHFAPGSHPLRGRTNGKDFSESPVFLLALQLMFDGYF